MSSARAALAALALVGAAIGAALAIHGATVPETAPAHAGIGTAEVLIEAPEDGEEPDSLAFSVIK